MLRSANSMLRLLVIAAALLASGCRMPSPALGVITVDGPNPERPHLRYLDGQVSMNDTCAIRRGNRLNPAVPPMRVNGRPIGFC